MTNRPWFRFYPSDWTGDHKLRACTLGAKGLWVDLLCIMDQSDERGCLLINGHAPTMAELSRMVGVHHKTLYKHMDNLIINNVIEEREDGVFYSRKMVRETAKSKTLSEQGKKGGHPNIRRGTVPKKDRVRRYNRSDSPAKTGRILQKSNGLCHWCGVELIWGDDDPTSLNVFHVDHVIPVCDGGTSDEKNLVASCRECNGKRATLSDSGDNPPHYPIYQSPDKEKLSKKKVPKKPVEKSNRGSRLSPDWSPSESDIGFASELGVQDIKIVADQFRDYWISKSGASATKVDWNATWRNWCRKASENKPAPVEKNGRFIVKKDTREWDAWKSYLRRISDWRKLGEFQYGDEVSCASRWPKWM